MKMATNKQAQILQLTPPSEILLEGPFDQVVTSYLELKNPSDQRVCFKVKTTAPKRYCVRPNSGIVDPGSKVKIAIMFQPIENDSQSERSKHKFMVQSTVIRDESSNLESVWQSATQADIMDSKLRCVFQMPSSQVNTEDTTTTTSKKGTSTSNVTKTPTAPAKSLSNDLPFEPENDLNMHPEMKRYLNEPIQESPNTVSRTPKSYNNPEPTSSSPKSWGANVSKAGSGGDKTLTSSHNLTSSFLQPMSDDYKLLLVSLAMLFIGVILGKYII